MKTVLLKTICPVKEGKKPCVKFRLFEIKDRALHHLVAESNLPAIVEQLKILDNPPVLIEAEKIKKVADYNGKLQELTPLERYRFLKYQETR